MSGLTSPYFWYTSRTTGVVSLVFLTLVCVAGILVSTRVGGRRIGRFELNEIHRSLSMSAMIFVGIHVITTVIDTYVPIGWISSVVPFTSPYKSLPVAIGTVAFDAMLAVWLTSLVKERLNFSSWRAVHWGSYVAFVTSALHAYTVGTDAHTHWCLYTLYGCLGTLLVAGIWRIFARPERAAGRTAYSPLQGRTPRR
ncbi:MAG: ferric reductase-like transmembrane domain-containing protein [Acidobacteria bacterium]|nr:ferric reductase-like transmembrane domain-containing protein [Acidobacteriota bacterium]